MRKNRQCHGRNINLRRCSRAGRWRFFCSDHKYQWINWIVFLVFTIAAGLASISSVFPIVEYIGKDKVVVPGEYNLFKIINKAKMEGAVITDVRNNALLGKVFVRPIAEFIDEEDNWSHIAVTLMSPFRPLGTNYTYKADDCRFLGKASFFYQKTKEARFYIYAASCTRNDGSIFSADAREIENVSEIGYLSLPGLSGKEKIPLIRDGRHHSLPMDTNVEVFLDYSVVRFTYVGQSPNK